MARLTYIFLLLFFFPSCSNDDDDTIKDKVQYKERMRNFVIGISKYTKSFKNEFIIIPQNGQELLTSDGEKESTPASEYLAAIDGVGREDLFYGYNEDNQFTPASDTEYMSAFLDSFEQNNIEVLTTDYCWDHSKIDDSYQRNAAKGYISFAAPNRELNRIPDYPLQPYQENANDITTLSQAKNFLYLLNSDQFSTKQSFIDAISKTNYDVLIIDLFFNESAFTSSEVSQLKIKKNGGQRLVIAYMSIGEAENYRYYWNSAWKVGSPSWIKDENPDWAGNYKVMYWEKEWQDFIFGNVDSYSKKVIDAGFQGVYLDIIDAFEYFE